MPSDHSYIGNAEPAFIESLYRRFLSDPLSLESGWRTFFEGFEFARKTYGEPLRACRRLWPRKRRC